MFIGCFLLCSNNVQTRYKVGGLQDKVWQRVKNTGCILTPRLSPAVSLANRIFNIFLPPSLPFSFPSFLPSISMEET